MVSNIVTIGAKEIVNRIFTIREKQVMLDYHLAEIYNIETRTLNQAVKRNEDRFPESFMFQLTEEEYQNLTSQFVVSSSDESLRSQFVILKTGRGKHRKYLPFVFTEQGVAMLSAVLRSETAVRVSIEIMNAFVEMRKLIGSHIGLLQRIDQVEIKQSEHDQKFEAVFKALESGQPTPKQGIFFDGQIFDAYNFVADIVRSAKKSVILLDNYVDDSVLLLLAKRDNGVSATIYTKSISNSLELDLKKHNSQYEEITIKTFDKSHDRFLIIDNDIVYHLGASLKDLGKKWFAFSLIEKHSLNILERL